MQIGHEINSEKQEEHYFLTCYSPPEIYSVRETCLSSEQELFRESSVICFPLRELERVCNVKVTVTDITYIYGKTSFLQAFIFTVTSLEIYMLFTRSQVFWMADIQGVMISVLLWIKLIEVKWSIDIIRGVY